MGQEHPPVVVGRAGRVSLSLTLPFQQETYSVSELCEEVRELLRQAYSDVWVAGEVNRVKTHRSGHFYFELIEKGDDDRIVGKLEAVAWRNEYRQIRQLLGRSGQELAEGQTIRCRGTLDFYPPFGRLQLVVREVDPVFTLGLLARRRQETMAVLAAAGLLERNRALSLAAVPLEVGLVTSHGSAAYHDFLSSLAESGYGFRIRFVHAAVQGREAAAEIVSAMESLGETGIEALVLIRGGGSRADLAVFDSRRVAESVARAPVPVLTGLGHEIDESIADRVAHSAFKTPTKVAEYLVERVAAADRRVAEVRAAVARSGSDVLSRSRRSLERCEREVGLARHRLMGAGRELDFLARRLPKAARGRARAGRRRLVEVERRVAVSAPLGIERRRRLPADLMQRLGSRSGALLREWSVKLSEWERLCVQLAPERTLERGFSITRDAGGQALTSPEQVAPGDRLEIQLARGRLAGRVEES